MKIKYKSNKLQKFYCKREDFQKKYGKEVALGLISLLDYIEASSSAYDIKVMPQYHMHILYGDMKGIYSLSVDNKKSKWRMLLKCISNDDIWVAPRENEMLFLKEIRIVELGEFSDHYE